MVNRKRKVINGFALKTIYMVLNVALAFFMMPFILHTLGDRLYGIWILIGAVMGYSAYLDFGLSSAVGRFVSRALGRGDMDEVNEIVNTSFLIYVAIGIAAAFITFAVAVFAGRFAATPGDAGIIRALIMLLGLNVALGFPSRAFGSIIGASLRYEISEGIELSGLLLRNALILVLFSLGYGIITLGLILFGVSLLSYALYVFFAFRTAKGLRVGLRLYNGARARELFSYSIYTFINRLGEILIFRIDAVVIGAFIGAAAVAHYSIAATIVSYFIYFMHNAFSLMGPVYSQDEGRGDEEGIRRKFLITSRVSVYMAAFTGAMAIFYGDEFISIWMGASYLDAYPALAVLLCATLFYVTQMPATTVLYNISRHRFLAWAGVAEGLANLALSMLLVKEHGMLGVAIGTAVPMAVTRLVIQPLYVCRVLRISALKYYAWALAWPSALAAAALVPAFAYFKGFAAPDYWMLAVLSAAHFVIYGAVIFAAGFSSEDRRYLLDYFARGGKAPAPWAA